VPADVARDGVDANLVRTTSGGTTPATSGALTGTANADLLVEIFDGTTAKGIVRVGASGTFTHTMNVAVGARSITAKALSGIQPVSEAWTFDVAAAVTPAITSVKDPQNTEIPNGGITVASSVTLTGTASANQQVEIFDGPTSRGTATVGANGTWSHAITVAAGTRSITAKGLYGTQPVSAARTFSVMIVATGAENFEGLAEENLAWNVPRVFTSGLSITPQTDDPNPYRTRIIASYNFPGTGARFLQVGRWGKVTLEFGGLIRAVSFDYAAVNYPVNHVEFKDAAGVTINTQSLQVTVGTPAPVKHISYTASGSRYIASVIIFCARAENDAGIGIDNIHWE